MSEIKYAGGESVEEINRIIRYPECDVIDLGDEREIRIRSWGIVASYNDVFVVTITGIMADKEERQDG